jgi:hypothetical protein
VIILAILCDYIGDAEGIWSWCLSKAMPSSEIDASDETLNGGRLFGTAALLLASVVTCTLGGVMVPMRTSSWVNVITTPPGPSSVSRRLSREFKLGENVRNQEDGNEVTNK